MTEILSTVMLNDQYRLTYEAQYTFGSLYQSVCMSALQMKSVSFTPVFLSIYTVKLTSTSWLVSNIRVCTKEFQFQSSI